jgi:ABC-type glycerol-3-phosphate transport system substrate-binding protein
LQKSGQWTWDAFIDLCKKLTRDTNNDGITDTYALATFSKDTTDAIVVSNGARYFDKDATGKFVNATGRPEFLQALQFVVRLNREGYLMPQPPNAEWNWFVSAFHDGKAAMRVGPEYVSGELQDMVDDWGFVLFPKGPRVTDYKYNADENVYVIPRTFTPEQADKILYSLYQWLTPAPGNDAPDAWKGGQYNRYRDARAVDETLTMLRDPKYSMMAYNAFIPGTDTANISDTIWVEGADPAQLIESISQPWNNAVNQVNGVR